MSVTQVFDLVKQYAISMGQPAETMIEVLTAVSDEHSIPLKVYGGNLDVTQEPRQVLDVLEISMTNMMGVSRRSIKIEPGVTLLYGPNGSGKSTTMRALLYTLFGAPAAGLRLAEDFITNGQSETEVKVTFAGGAVNRGVERKVISKGKNAGQTDVIHTLSAQIAGDKANKAKESQALIDNWLGVDGDFVRRVCCLEQGMLTQLMDEQPARRRELFYRMLDLEPAEETRKALSKALQIEENKRANNQQSIEALTKEIEGLRHKRAGYPLAKMLSQREALLPQASKASVNPQEVKEAQMALSRRELDLITARKQGEDTKSYLAKIDELKRDPDLNKIVEDSSSSAASASRSFTQAQQEATKAKVELDALTKRGQEVKSLPSVCPVCSAVGKMCEVTPEVKEGTLRTIREQWIETSKRLKQCEESRDHWQSDLDAYAKRQAETLRVKSRQAFVAEQIKLLNEALSNLPEKIDIISIQKDIEKLSESLKAKQSVGSPQILQDLQDLYKLIGEADALDNQIQANEVKIVNLRGDALMPNDHLEAFRFAVAAFAKDGLPLYLARQHLGRVNEIAGELCTLDKYKYRFGSELDIQVFTGSEGGGAFNMGPSLACGSARERGSVVLMAALGRYLQELSGLQIPFLWIDELPFQDEANAHLVVDMVKRLTQWYPKVILCASRWDEYLEQFDHEIALLPEDVAIELDRQRQAKDADEKAQAPRGAKEKAKGREQVINELTLQAESKYETTFENHQVTVRPRVKKQTEKQYIALCPTHEKDVDLEQIAVIKSLPMQCVVCAKNGGRAVTPAPERPTTILERADSVVAQAEAALASSAPKMDADLEEDCPF